MKLLYCSDLHGNEAHNTRLARLAAAERPDVVVLGGDLLPDDSALDPPRMGHTQPQFVRRQFRNVVVALRRACECKAVLLVFGNHDWTSSVTAMQELADEGLVTILDHKNATRIDGLDFLGYSCTPPTPWYVKDFERLDRPGDPPPLLGGARWDPRFSRANSYGAAALFESQQTITEELAALHAPAGPWVFVAHAPPYETHLDRTYDRVPLGSRAIRDAIEKHQPILSLHGHVHESPTVTGKFRDNIARTVCINAGQTRSKLHYVSLRIELSGERKGPSRGAEITQVRHGESSTPS